MRLCTGGCVLLSAGLWLAAAACATPPPVHRLDEPGADVSTGRLPSLPVPDAVRAPALLDDGGCVRVLSIDGGGIRGVIPALMVAELERRTGRPAAELFDVIVGTSTGAVLALGLSRGAPGPLGGPAYTAGDIVGFYEREGTAIFSTGFPTMRSLWGFLGPKYSPRGLERALDRYFGETRLDQARTLVEIPAYEIEDRKHFFFRSDVHTFLMRDVARAATAAPAYFPPVTLPIDPRLNRKGYVALIDGGVFANNPAPYALAAASSVRPGSRDVLLVSLGTGAMPLPMPYAKASTWGLLGWARPLITMLFADHGVDDAFRHVLPPGRYFRFQAEPIDVRRTLDDASIDSIQALKRQGEVLIATKTEELNDLAHRLRLKRPADCPPHIATRASS